MDRLNLKREVVKALYREMHWDHTVTVDDTQPLSEMGVDSMKAIIIMYNLEEQFGIEVPNDAIHKVKTVDDIATLLEELLSTKD